MPLSNSNLGHSGRRIPDEMPLPSPQFKTVRELVIDESVRPGMFISFIGLVKDYQMPFKTPGRDYKATMSLYDLSVQYDSVSIAFNMFRPSADEYPDEINAGDVVLLYRAKCQKYGGQISLITHFSTAIRVYSKPKIPRPPRSAEFALMEARGKPVYNPTQKEHEYVSWMYHKIDKYDVPDDAEFDAKKAVSVNVKEKFSLLKDVRDGAFYDIKAQLVRAPYDSGDKMTLWVSDYTENEYFFLYTPEEGDLIQDGLHGHTSDTTQTSRWKGPHGKRSMQITCYEPHVSYLRDEDVKVGEWLFLRNVQVKFGSNGLNLEGYLREDRNYHGNRIQISVLDLHDGDGVLDPKLKDSIRRKRDYEKTRRKDSKGIRAPPSSLGEVSGRDTNHEASDHSHGNGAKRKTAGEPEKMNSKRRRSAKRAADRQRDKEKEAQFQTKLDLNPDVRCEHMDEPITPIPGVLTHVPYETNVNGDKTTISLPFICAKFRTVGRVVNFSPPNIMDFAVPRKVNEYDVLSDYSHSGTDLEDTRADDVDQGGDDNGQKTVWEWRFALLVEDTYPAHRKNATRDQMWVVLDNWNAQHLLNMDASNLKTKSEDLNNLRQKLSTLWGDLEELKQSMLAPHSQKWHLQRGLREHPPDSSDNEADVKSADLGSKVSNKPFSFCLKQYGVKFPENDPAKADAAKGKRWGRVFGMFGTKICG